MQSSKRKPPINDGMKLERLGSIPRIIVERFVGKRVRGFKVPRAWTRQRNCVSRVGLPRPCGYSLARCKPICSIRPKMRRRLRPNYETN
eukprot:scaffold4855_cov195-Amphora_coffeaeformis.AAC.22